MGIRTVRKAGPRLDRLKRTLKDLGGEVESFYLTMGPYDTVAVVTLADDATMAKLVSRIGVSGDSRAAVRSGDAGRAKDGVVSLPT